MKTKFLYLLLFASAYCGISGCNQRADIGTEKANVKKVVDQFAQFWETEDMELLSIIMSHDADMVNYGSDADEIFVGWDDFRESVEKMLPALENTRIKVRDQVIKVHTSGNVAWFSEIWDWTLTAGGNPVQVENQRLTGVLEKRNGSWIFV